MFPNLYNWLFLHVTSFLFVGFLFRSHHIVHLGVRKTTHSGESFEIGTHEWDSNHGNEHHSNIDENKVDYGAHVLLIFEDDVADGNSVEESCDGMEDNERQKHVPFSGVALVIVGDGSEDSEWSEDRDKSNDDANDFFGNSCLPVVPLAHDILAAHSAFSAHFWGFSTSSQQLRGRTLLSGFHLLCWCIHATIINFLWLIFVESSSESYQGHTGECNGQSGHHNGSNFKVCTHFHQIYVRFIRCSFC